jgi:hypothetical protein
MAPLAKATMVKSTTKTARYFFMFLPPFGFRLSIFGWTQPFDLT